MATEADAFQSLFPLVGGALALAGGVFTFVSGRLKEASGPEGKKRVVTLTIRWLSVALNALALLAVIFGKGFAVPVLLLSLAFVLQIVLFLRIAEPVERVDVVGFSLLSGFYIFFLASAVSMHFVGRTLDLIDKLTTIVK
jgi:hypothetical protein